MHLHSLAHPIRAAKNVLGIGLPPRRPVFLHIPKTAGTSVRMMFDAQFRGRFRVVAQTHEAVRRVQRMPEWRFQRAAFYAGHFGMDTVRRVRAPTYKIIFLRDPVDRTVSLYHYLRTFDLAQWPEEVHRAIHLANRLSLSDFIRCDAEYVRCGWEDKQARTLIEPEENMFLRCMTSAPGERATKAIAIAETFDCVGTVPSIADDLRKIGADLQIPIPDNIHVHATSKRLALRDLPRSDRTVIEQFTQADQALYDWARA